VSVRLTVCPKRLRVRWRKRSLKMLDMMVSSAPAPAPGEFGLVLLVGPFVGRLALLVSLRDRPGGADTGLRGRDQAFFILVWTAINNWCKK